MISTLFGLLARVYLVNFIPTELSNRENINQSIANNLCKMDDIIFENMQKNKNLSKMIDTRMQLIVKSTQTTLEEFNRMLNYGFKSSLEEFENMITSLTKNIKNASEKQSEILLKEYEKINKKNKEYQEIIEKQNDAIQNINKNKEYQEIIEKQNDAIQNINKNIQDIHQQINKP
ncbi:hypothetical protein MNB_ARC-1_661 [hydrothermal vent metagenome]|uniref:Uncharacterized protein n=1 Tax=hydrothermal vent metagenome TaxID=652676 RepID=A0A3B1E4T3_9ZZZZ